MSSLQITVLSDEARALLERIEEFLADQADAEYFTDSPAPIPNEAMKLQMEVKALLSRPTWTERLVAERERIGRPLTLDEMISLAKGHRMTPEEIESQRQSWARQEMD